MTTTTIPPFHGLWTRLRAAPAPTPRRTRTEAAAALHRAAVAAADARLDDLERRLDALRKDVSE